MLCADQTSSIVAGILAFLFIVSIIVLFVLGVFPAWKPWTTCPMPQSHLWALQCSLQVHTCCISSLESTSCPKEMKLPQPECHWPTLNPPTDLPWLQIPQYPPIGPKIKHVSHHTPFVAHPSFPPAPQRIFDVRPSQRNWWTVPAEQMSVSPDDHWSRFGSCQNISQHLDRCTSKTMWIMRGDSSTHWLLWWWSPHQTRLHMQTSTTRYISPMLIDVQIS